MNYNYLRKLDLITKNTAKRKMVESAPTTTDGELRKIKVKQLNGPDIELSVNKDVS